MDLLDRINALTDDQLQMVAERNDASGVLAAYRLAELRGLPYPDREAAVLGDGYVIVAQNGSVQKVPVDSVSKIIRQEGGEYCVYSEDGARSFGCYPSMEDAEARLRQIHVFREAEAACKLWIIPEDQVKESIKALSKDSSFLRKQAARRFTLGPLYVPDFMDAHGEWTDADELQQAVWKWVQSGNRTIYLQHDRDVRAGEWVEVMTMPQPWKVNMMDGSGNAVGSVTYPAGTVFLGVIWDDGPWQRILRGELRGYSIGGFSDRVLADLPEEAARDGIELPQEA